MPTINGSVHPNYQENEEDFKKWRLTLEGGSKYKKEYLVARPKESDFATRYDMSYVPAFAKEAVLEISRAIHQRLPRVMRSGGSGTYLEACKGGLLGVDRRGSTMNSFISMNVVNELCFLGIVGVYVDNIKPISGLKATLKEGDHPYLYAYKREDIRDWAPSADDPNKLQYVILRDTIDVFDPETGLRDKQEKRFRHIFLNSSGTVTVRFYNEAGRPLDAAMQPADQPFDNVLELTRIPFAKADIGPPLVADVADYQVSHMMLSSLDMNYAGRSNIPFYVEQRAPFSGDMYAQQYVDLPKDEDGNPVDPQDLADDVREKYIRDRSQLLVGATMGRVYSTNTDRPSFIHPSPEPLKASMEKQEVMKAEIRELVALSLKQAGLRFQSESSKKMDDRPLEAGLSYLGLVIESLETEINAIWSEYEGKERAVIKYPETYNLMTESERREAIKQDKELMSVVPSQTFRTEMQKSIINTKFAHVLDPAIVSKMEQEVTAIQAPTSDPKEIRSDVEAGLLSAEFGSEIRGYPKGEAAKAQVEKANRLGIANQLQSVAHTNQDTLDSGTAKEVQRAEKTLTTDPDLNDTDNTRGKGKSNNA